MKLTLGLGMLSAWVVSPRVKALAASCPEEARAYAEAVGWETSDVEFIATRLWLCYQIQVLRSSAN